MIHPFSLKEVAEATRNFNLKTPLYVEANDKIQLAFYSFVPQSPKAVIVFYHGGGAWSKAMYQLMAQETSLNHNMAVYLFDIRGHGYSKGARGDAPTSQQVWDDVDVALNFVKKKHADIPVFLAGHSSGCGLIINYISQIKSKKADGYFFLAPFLGSYSETDIKYVETEKKFVSKVRTFILITHAFSGGWLFAHVPAIYFNYSLLNKVDPLMLSYYTCAMASAVFPRNSSKIFTQINEPCALFIGQEDEQFDPVKVVAYGNYFQNKQQSVFRVVSNANHLSIVLRAPVLFEEFWNKRARTH